MVDVYVTPLKVHDIKTYEVISHISSTKSIINRWQSINRYHLLVHKQIAYYNVAGILKNEKNTRWSLQNLGT